MHLPILHVCICCYDILHAFLINNIFLLYHVFTLHHVLIANYLATNSSILYHVFIHIVLQALDSLSIVRLIFLKVKTKNKLFHALQNAGSELHAF